MKYNIDFEIVALIFTIMLYIFHKLQYNINHTLNKQFRTLLRTTIIMTALNIITAVTFSFYEAVPPLVNMLLNCAYFSFQVTLSYFFSVYIATMATHSEELVMSKFNTTICVAYDITLLVNMFFGFMFYFDENGYQHSSLFFISGIVTYYYIIYGCAFFFRRRKNHSKRELISTSIYFIMMLIFLLEQILLPPTFLVSGTIISIVLIIMLFTLETPDYSKLQQAMIDLEEAKLEADRANSAKSDFLANMSHEIRTPINAIMGMNEMILRENTNPEIEKYSTNILRASETLLSIINEILDFSKVESGKTEIIKNEYDFKEVLLDLKNMFEIKASDKKLDFAIEADEALPSILLGDEIHLKQVLINILNNAIKYTNVGYVKLRISGEKSNNTLQMKIECIDTGIGIKPEDVDRLFNKFERLEINKNKTVEGTGLGLPIAGRLIKLMNGDIEISSNYGKGSNFIITLTQEIISYAPIGNLYEEEETVEEETKEQEFFTAPNARVLIVDDNDINLMILANLLERTQMTVDTALSGYECLDLLKENHYDAVFLDHMMPEMDGVETLQKAKELPDNSNHTTPFIVVTANAINGVKKSYLENGFDDYLSKPIIIDELEAVLYKYITVY